LFDEYRVAAFLHKTRGEIMQMTIKEYFGWLAFLKIIEGDSS